MTVMDKLAGRKTLKVGNILDEFEKDKVKAGVDLVALFSSFGVQLESKGKSYMGKCPWHEDSTPSLSVDREKGLYNCFGCGESGDAFTLVEKMKGCNFKGALEYLKGGRFEPVPVPSPSPSKPAVVATQPQVPAPAVMNQEDDPFESPEVESLFFDGEENLLNPVAEWYENVLRQNTEAQSYLAGRGLDVAIQGRFVLGYSCGNLHTGLMKRHRKPLQGAGILRADGGEFFAGCVVVPLFDDLGQVVSFYGRKIDDSTPKHLYLKGKHRGLVNGKAAKVYPDELILTESVFDALSLVSLGFENVIPCYGTNGFTADHLEAMKEARTRMVVLAFDADDAGRKGAAALKEELLAEGIAVKTLEPVGAKDWNEYLTSDGKADTIRALIDAASIEGMADPDAPDVSRDGKRWNFKFGEVVYRVLPSVEVFVSSLKVNIRAEAAEELFLDNCDLYSSRSRSSFALAFSRVAGLESIRIEKDLMKIVTRLEKERDKALDEANPRQVIVEPSEAERSDAEAFLRSPTLFDDIASDMDAVGYVGEEVNKLVVYVAAVSRLLEKPLSVYVQAGSSSGKSFLIETVRRLLPQEAVLAISSFSDQALNYMKQEDLEGKVMLMGEAIHNDLVEGQIRQMQSEGEISRLMVAKDPKTGALESRQVRNRVRLSFMMSSTALYLNPENASRCLVLHTDESRAQTERILSLQREKKTFDGYLAAAYRIPAIIKKHQTAGRILERLPVFNPLAGFIRFPVNRPTMRRAQDQFLTLLEAVAILRQYQKERVTKTNPFTGETVEGIDIDLEDYRIARRLFREAVLIPNADELPSGARLLYESIQTMAKAKAHKEGLEATEVTFIQREIRELSELGSDSIKKYLRALVDFEFLELTGGRKHGTRFCYRLRNTGNEITTGVELPEVEELSGLLAETGEVGKTGEFPSSGSQSL
jgi:DNA primase